MASLRRKGANARGDEILVPEAMSAGEIESEIARLKAQRREFAQANRGPFREQVHAFLDQRRAEARASADGHFAKIGPASIMHLPLTASPDAPSVPNHVALHAVVALAADDAYWRKLHKLADAADGYPAISKTAFDSETGRLDRAIGELEKEQMRRLEAAAEAAKHAGLAATM